MEKESGVYRGRCLKYGDNINTDIISPPMYMELPIEQAAAYAMSPIDPEFASKCRPGDIFVAEKNLGSGSSRETAPLALKELGIRIVLAKSYARIFYRNCINLGILAIECSQTDKIAYFDEIEIDYKKGVITNRSSQETYRCQAIPKHIVGLTEKGGLFACLMERREKVDGSDIHL